MAIEKLGINQLYINTPFSEYPSNKETWVKWDRKYSSRTEPEKIAIH